jgi:hypothetical protein
VDGLDLIGSLHSAVLNKDGEIGAEQGAQTAIDALGIIGQFGGMIALGVGAPGHNKHVLGAELDAVATALAPFLNDVNDAMGNLDLFSIQGLSPVAHSPSSILR